ncbi:hypothetical protein [Legionella rowbothamii]|uniref:hypothetical protein n=1 Tax=Legionella rowbothamii TaxID=96229 RepID=UPI001F5E71D5|nr:hypothetical protein [Legionella rowbothamii]
MPNSPITIKKTDRFFIAIAKIEVHSFVLFGVYNQFKVNNLLSRVGKVFDDSKIDDTCIDECMRPFYFLSGGIAAQLMDEGVFRKKRRQAAINYQAYDISYEQYLEYLTILSNLSTQKNAFYCYQPNWVSEEQIILKYDKVPRQTSSNENVAQIKQSVASLNVGNTCRHSAIALVEAVQKEPISTSVSSYFFRDLPYKTILEFGQPTNSIPFYVLPAPPSAYIGLGDEKELILRDLYAGMERLPHIAPHDQITMDKFSRLKELYNNIAGPQKDVSLNELLQNIQVWKSKNCVVLDTLREKFWGLDFFFKRTSATMLLVNNVESRLEKFITSSLTR